MVHRIGVVGGGWRAQFFLRLASTLKETTSWGQSLNPIVAGCGIFRSPVCFSGELKKKLRSLI